MEYRKDGWTIEFSGIGHSRLFVLTPEQVLKRIKPRLYPGTIITIHGPARELRKKQE